MKILLTIFINCFLLPNVFANTYEYYGSGRAACTSFPGVCAAKKSSLKTQARDQALNESESKCLLNRGNALSTYITSVDCGTYGDFGKTVVCDANAITICRF